MWFLWLLGCAQQPHWPTERPADICEAGAGPKGEVALVLSRPARRRVALLWTPDGPGPHDVIVNLHEFRSEPRRQNHYTGWVQLAKERNAYLVGPDGKSSMWNAGGCCGKARDQNIDDVGFLDAIIARLDETGCTSGKVLATGIGNGGMMAHRWACESDVVDAVVSVGGALQLPTCEQTRPIPTLMYHGTADEWMPLDGSGNHMTLAHAEAQWLKRNQAGAPTPLRDGPLHCEVRAGAADVAVCKVQGMKDVWPGASDAQLDGVTHPLGDATRGAFDWVRSRW